MNLETAVEQEGTEGTENEGLRNRDLRIRGGFPIHHLDGAANGRPFLALRFLCLLLLKF
jgi:hypothetical protein